MATLNISDKLWKYLNDHRVTPNDTFEDIIWRFIAEDPSEVLTAAHTTPPQSNKTKQEINNDKKKSG